MYGDLKLTENGDLAIAQAKVYGSLNVGFSIYENKGLRISFALTGFYESLPLRENTLRVSFDIEERKIEYAIPAIKDNDFLNQYVKLRLMALKGEIKERTEFGTTLNNHRFENINKELKAVVENIIFNEFKDDIEGLDVKVAFNSNGYKTGVRISIYSTSGLIINYELER